MTVIPTSGPHGGDGTRLAAALGVRATDVLDLSASLNPFAPDPTGVLAGHLGAIGRYPDSEPARDALANAMGVSPNQLLLTNGGSEAIALACDHVVRVFGAGSLRAHDFSLYERHLRAIRPEAPRVCSNPCNPTGALVDPSRGVDHDGVRVAVWDEAFWQLATGTWTSHSHERGAIVVGSLTKLFACPGLRLGYVLADARTVTEMAERQPRWAVSTLAAEALPDLLATARLTEWALAIDEARDALISEIDSRGFAATPGVTWVLVSLAGSTGAELRHCFAQHLIGVRDCASFGLEAWVRIAIPRPSERAHLLAALSAIGTRR